MYARPLAECTRAPLMYAHALAGQLLDLSQKYPVLTLLGPRQSGKTTLVRQLFADKPYVNLESPDIRARARADGRAFIESYRLTGAICDEVSAYSFCE